MRGWNLNARTSGYTSKPGRRLPSMEQEKQSCCVSGEAQCCLELDDSISSTPGYHHIHDIFWTTWNAQNLITFPVTRHLPQAGLRKKSYSWSRKISASIREAGFHLSEGLDRLRREMVKTEKLLHHTDKSYIENKYQHSSLISAKKQHGGAAKITISRRHSRTSKAKRWRKKR